MPNKYAEKKGWKLPKQKYKVSNWSEYNKALRQRGSIDVWLSNEMVDSWYEPNQIYDGTGTPKKFSDLAITACHEIRSVFKLALRQCQGFIDSLFSAKKLLLTCPDFSCLSKRLAKLKLKSPRYKKTDQPDENIAAIAIDSTGLKRFGRDEWHQEKHKVSAKRSWRKLHIAVDNKHIIHGVELTDRFTSDDQVVEDLVNQVDNEVDQLTADGAYDKNPVYEKITDKFPNAAIIIPPDSDAVYNSKAHPQRNQNLQDIQTFGRMHWQKIQAYGNRNISELAIQRYKKILGNKLHARKLERQKNEAMLGCGVLNKMTQLGMPDSFRCA